MVHIEDLKRTPEEYEKAVKEHGKKGRVTIHNMEKVVAAFDAWSKKETSLYLGDFTEELETYPQKLLQWRDSSPEFREMLYIVKGRITSRVRKLMQEGKFNYGIFMREIGFWDTLLHEYEREEKIFEASLKLQENQKASEDDIRRHNELMALLEHAQNKKT